MFRNWLLLGREGFSGGERFEYLEHHIFVHPRVYLEQFSWLCVCINDQDVAPGFL